MTLNNQKKQVLNAQDLLSIDQEALLKCLVNKVAKLAPMKLLQTAEETVNEVVLELDVNGTRYYLVRCASKVDQSVNLSPRELAIARLVAQGFPNKCVGNKLHISPWTVSTHLRRIFGKLSVSSRAAMVSKLMEIGLL